MNWPQLCRDLRAQSSMSHPACDDDTLSNRRESPPFPFWVFCATEQQQNVDMEQSEGEENACHTRGSLWNQGFHLSAQVTVAMWRLSGEQAVFKMSGWWAQLFTIQFVLICDSEFINLAHGSHFKFQFGLNACSDWGHIGKNKTI